MRKRGFAVGQLEREERDDVRGAAAGCRALKVDLGRFPYFWDRWYGATLPAAGAPPFSARSSRSTRTSTQTFFLLSGFFGSLRRPDRAAIAGTEICKHCPTRGWQGWFRCGYLSRRGPGPPLCAEGVLDDRIGHLGVAPKALPIADMCSERRDPPPHPLAPPGPLVSCRFWLPLACRLRHALGIRDLLHTLILHAQHFPPRPVPRGRQPVRFPGSLPISVRAQ